MFIEPFFTCFAPLIPNGEVLENYKKDYEENMVDGYIYENAMSFDELVARIVELQNSIRAIKL